MKKFLLIFGLLFSCVFANLYSESVQTSDFIEKIPKINDINCSFKQEKYLQGAIAPITSEGNFQFIKGEGVYFETLKPFHQIISYSDKNYRQINDLITAISNKNYDSLENLFNFFFEQNDLNWTLALEPKENTSSYDVIENIEISGNENIEKLQISLKNGNRTVIWFQTK